jgi:hypothetical protein
VSAYCPQYATPAVQRFRPTRTAAVRRRTPPARNGRPVAGSACRCD